MTDAPIRITFDGRVLHARRGISVAAALIEAGVPAWRATRGSQRPRGLFCGIGVCFDCLVTIDGLPGQRACLIGVRDGMEVSAHDDHID